MNELDFSHKPRPLPVLEASVPTGYFSEDAMDAFINREGNALRLSQMVRALIETGARQEALLLVDKQEELPTWIAAIQLNLPESLQRKVHFSTYVHDLERERYPIMATLGEGTRYYQEDIDQGVYGYVFDFIQNRFDPPAQNEYQVQARKEWHDFMNECTIQEVKEDLESATLLYQFLNEHKQLQSTDYERMLTFARTKASLARVKQVMDTISVDLLLYEKRHLEDTKQLALSLLYSSEKTKADVHKKKAVSYWVESLKGLLVDTKESEFDQLMAYADAFLLHFYASHNWNQLLFTDEQLKDSCKHLQQLNNGKKDVFYVELLFKQLAYEDNGNRVLSESKRRLAQSILDRNGREPDAEKRLQLWSLCQAHPALFAKMFGQCELTNWTDEELRNMRNSFRAILQEQAPDLNWSKVLLTELSLIRVDELYPHRLTNELAELLFTDLKARIEWGERSINQQIDQYKEWLNLSNRMKRDDPCLDCLISTYEVNQRLELKDTVGLLHTITIQMKRLKSEEPALFRRYYHWAMPLLANKFGQAGGTMFIRFIYYDVGMTIDCLTREYKRFEEETIIHVLRAIIPDVLARRVYQRERLKLIAYFAEYPDLFERVYHQLGGKLEAVEALRQDIEKPLHRTPRFYKRIILDRLPAR